MKLSVLKTLMLVWAICLPSMGDSAELIKVKSTRIIKAPEKSPLNMPTDVAVGPGGDVYVVDGVNHRILRFSPQGKYLSSFGRKGNAKGKLKSPLGIAAGKQGLIYIADTGNKRVQVFTAKGKFVKEIPGPSKGKLGAVDISDIVVDTRTDRLYLCDNDNHQIHVYDEKKNQYLNSWGGFGKVRVKFQYPFFLSLTPDGYLMVSETINNRVQVLNSKGKFISFIGKMGVEKGELYRPKGVTMLGEKVYITDSYLGRIQAFSLTGKYLGLLSDPNGKPLVFDTPTGISSDVKNNRLYVVELKAGQVRVVNLNK